MRGEGPAGATKRSGGGVGVAVVAGVVVFFVVGKGCSKAEGTFTATGEPIGDRTVNPVRCRSGQRMNFHGVMLLTEDDAVAIRVLEGHLKLECKFKETGGRARASITFSCD